MDAARHFELHARGPYSLAASTGFLEGFAAAALAPAESDHTHWAFATDDGASSVGICLQPRADGVAVDVFGDDDPGVRAQVERVLSLDIDGTGFAAVAERDPVVARLQERFPGLRPVLFFTPWEAAAWSAMSHRIRIRQAAAIKVRLTREVGSEIVVHGESRWAFPSPAQVLAAGVLPGLPERKAANLRAIAEAALEGVLDAWAACGSCRRRRRWQSSRPCRESATSTRSGSWCGPSAPPISCRAASLGWCVRPPSPTGSIRRLPRSW